MKKYLLIIVYIFLSCAKVSAQYLVAKDKEAINLLKQGTLAIVIKERDEKVLKKLSKKTQELQGYENSVDAYNFFLKQAIDSEWNFSKEVKFVSEFDAEKLKTEKESNHFILQIDQDASIVISSCSADDNNGLHSPQDLYNHLTSGSGLIGVSIISAADPANRIVFSYIPVAGLSLGSMTFTVQNLRNQLIDGLENNIMSLSDLKKDIEGRKTKLATKTLIIFDQLVNESCRQVIEKDKLDKFYKYPYEIVSSNDIDKVITSKKEKYAYIWLVPNGSASGRTPCFTSIIVDAVDGRFLYYSEKKLLGSLTSFHEFHLYWASKK